jgi:hypothetical protein
MTAGQNDGSSTSPVLDSFKYASVRLLSEQKITI